jgi:dTDP-4-dehydrorhamnose 3,5-epimerase
MSRFEIHSTPRDGLQVIQRKAVGDARGFLSRIFCAEDLASAGWVWPIAQINHTLTKIPGTVRGMHFQFPPKAEAKLVSCIRGAVWDVAVDIRRASDSFGAWYGVELSAEQGNMLWIPAGFAHGFLALEDETRLVYKCTAEYNSASERSIRWDDPELGITWPAAGPQGEYLLSGKDAAAPGLAAAEVFP